MKKCNHSDPDCLRCSIEDCEEKKKLYERHKMKENKKADKKDDDTDSSTYLSLLSYIP